ncbi:hypothetical protein FB446DRAFT_317801 [Lentinula raphanica]|uniref:Uncharacterized protein n=1 Tax=Lentinula raphanica TaxID=153919 RepID=A0AA38PGW3_9AGAR|nr:hypothetical protein C8R42DRAFT_232798 [Lentinula raphanica]KAJ3776255.1 hypothetical protein FB446DRAFT_317801 [Lentinula raphanica]KAJ3842674.1 hypothetical protein F5878DRAFT_371688 [Lentinula raphanica]
MQLLSVLFSLLVAAATSVLAQSANIGAPADMTQVAAGSDFTVMVDRPDSLTGSTEVAVVIGLLSCASSPCPGPSAELGTVLYNGPFDPQFTTEPGTTTLPPHENFTLTVPSNFAKGNAQLGVAHVYLLGASVSPEMETFNTTIVVT